VATILMIFPRVHYAFAEFRGGGAGSAPSKYAPESSLQNHTIYNIND